MLANPSSNQSRMPNNAITSEIVRSTPIQRQAYNSAAQADNGTSAVNDTVPSSSGSNIGAANIAQPTESTNDVGGPKFVPPSVIAIQKETGNTTKWGPRWIIFCPNRALAILLYDMMVIAFKDNWNVRPVLVCGTANSYEGNDAILSDRDAITREFEDQIQNLPLANLVIATPGRWEHHSKNGIDFSNVELIIFEQAELFADKVHEWESLFVRLRKTGLAGPCATTRFLLISAQLEIGGIGEFRAALGLHRNAENRICLQRIQLGDPSLVEHHPSVTGDGQALLTSCCKIVLRSRIIPNYRMLIFCNTVTACSKFHADLVDEINRSLATTTSRTRQQIEARQHRIGRQVKCLSSNVVDDSARSIVRDFADPNGSFKALVCTQMMAGCYTILRTNVVVSIGAAFSAEGRIARTCMAMPLQGHGKEYTLCTRADKERLSAISRHASLGLNGSPKEVIRTRLEIQLGQLTDMARIAKYNPIKAGQDDAICLNCDQYNPNHPAKECPKVPYSGCPRCKGSGHSTCKCANNANGSRRP